MKVFDVLFEVDWSTIEVDSTINIKVDKNRFILCEGDDFLVYDMKDIGTCRFFCLRTYPYDQLSTRVKVRHFWEEPEFDFAEVINEDKICFPDPRQFT